MEDNKGITSALCGEELIEVYSRLINTGKDSALKYLEKDLGIGAEDALRYVEELEKQEQPEEPVHEPEYKSDGSMTESALLDTVKLLKPGDRIHLEYKPLIGKRRTYDGIYSKLEVIVPDRYFSLRLGSDDYHTLTEDIMDSLYEYMRLVFFCEEKGAEDCCYLKQIIHLQII